METKKKPASRSVGRLVVALVIVAMVVAVGWAMVFLYYDHPAGAAAHLVPATPAPTVGQ
jgi:multidrug resistance efflux pump